MATIFQSLITCLTGAEPEPSPTTISDEKHTLLPPHQPHTAEEVAEQVIHAIITAEKSGAELSRTLNNIVSEYGWTEKIAQWVLVKMESALKEVEKLQGPLKDAYNKACEAALAVEGFVQEHPVFCTVIALGVLVVLTPWVLGALGFGELGPVEGMLMLTQKFACLYLIERYLGSFAAGWQARYAGYVPKRSLFSFFQRLGMKWH